jgi:TatD DNase family protein
MSSSSAVCDSHVHLDDALDDETVIDQIRALKRVDRMALQSVSVDDWSRVLSLSDAMPTIVIAGLGIHPWQAPAVDADDAWLARLRSLLQTRPQAFVGEIGLDKVARYPDTGVVEFAKQHHVFLAQFRLAAELRRPVSVHCVQAHGVLLDLLRNSDSNDLPPTIALHSFSGKATVVEEYLRAAGNRTRLFFGFSAIICLRSEERSRAAIARVPDDRLLIESDIGETSRIDELIDRILDVVSEVKQWSKEETSRIVNQNATTWMLREPDDDYK